MEKRIKIAYIGGGSKQWARIFLSDLALTDSLGGEVALYDIDRIAAERNRAIAARISRNPAARSHFVYTVSDTLEAALDGADFVVISILPGTFREMRSDVHAPEAYGIFQPVGDTVGPGGVLRAMRTVPIYETFARAIRAHCPKAWVINFTNPMSICTKALYDVFPEIKAFGCCHEVFHAQEFLLCALRELKGIRATRHDIYADACGINHFTWITEAKYGNFDLLSLLPEFKARFFEEGYFELGGRFDFRFDPFAYGNKVKLDLFERYGALAAAGDRHLVEFLPRDRYLKDRETIRNWQFNLTTVDYREKQQAERVAETIEMAEGRKEFPLVQSEEEAVALIKAILGFGPMVSNVNLPNRGQMSQLPLGSVVETNCVFSNDQVKPVLANPLPEAAAELVRRNCANIDLTYEGIRERNLDKLLLAFQSQPLCEGLPEADARTLFRAMCEATKDYLSPYFDLAAL